MERREMRQRQRKKKKWKIIWFSLLAVVLIVAAGGLYEFYRLQPAHHFAKAPVLGSNSKSGSNTSSALTQTKNSINLLLLGTDERAGDKIGHSDSILLLHIDLKTKQYSAVSIPRDTRVDLPGYGYTKLTSVQYIIQADKSPKAGVVAAANAVSRLTGVPINYYVETNYLGLEAMVNALGTVTVNVPFDVTFTHPWYPKDKGMVIHKGTQTLDGKMLTELVHERHSLPNGDYGRQQLQEKAIVGIAKAAMKPSNFTKLPNLIKSSNKFIIDTNMSTSDMLSLGMTVKGFNPSKDLTYYQLKGQSKSMYDDILKANNDEIILDPTSVKTVMQHFK